MTLNRFNHDSPIGPLTVLMRGDALALIGFPTPSERAAGQMKRVIGSDTVVDGPVHRETAAALDAYFGGELDALSDLPVEAKGTDFERLVWRALRDIPAGQTRSYRDVARVLGRPNATRAVGRANGVNPVPLVVPCHRVIGADGSLTGFGGGVETKAWLLRHEGALLV